MLERIIHGLGLLSLCAPLAAQAVPEIAFEGLRRAFPDDGSADREGLRRITLVDWDGDGDLDALRCSHLYQCGSSVGLLRNDGEGRFAEDFELPHPALACVAGDLDGDGDPDAWVTGNGGTHRILWNDGAAGVRLAPAPAGAQALADVDGDGRLDALQEELGLYWIRNLGHEAFAPRVALDARPCVGSVIADLDGDGDPDAFRVLPDGLAFLYGDGAGGFAEQELLPPAFLDLEPPTSALVAAADVDGDGLAEVFYSDTHLVDPHAVHMLRNRGAHRFEDASADLPELEDVSFLVPADVEGDGDLDLLTSQGVLANDGGGRFQFGAALPTGSAVSAGDVDGDGAVDLVYGATGQVLFGDGAGTFRGLALEPAASGGSTLGDLDGDGDLDVGALKNDGRGELTREPATELGALEDGAALEGDLDGDGDLDLLFPGADVVATNDGHGVLGLGGACSDAVVQWTDAALGDLDGDGDLDAYLGRSQVRFNCDPGPCYVPLIDALLLNDGAGCFHDASAFLPQVARSTRAVALADVDGDGNLDVVTTAPALLLGAGGGAFADASDRVASVPFARDVAAGDLEGDGDLDLYFAGAPDVVLWNDGSAHFPAASQTPGAGMAVALGDLDGDGDLDVVECATSCAPQTWPSELRVLANEGAGFREVQRSSGNPRTLSLGDLDQDGDLDLFDGQRVAFNLRRALAQRGRARPGHGFELELFGSRGGGALLIAASALRPVATRHGLRQVALDTRLLARPIALDASGTATATFAVPGDPTLVGATLHWQALMSAPLAWSNRETTSVTAF